MKKVFFGIFMVLTFLVSARELQNLEYYLSKPDDILGLTLKEAYSVFGVPDEVFPLRGAEEYADDVVFFYSANHLYLYWYQNRVFQVSFDSRYKGEFYKFKMGYTKDQVKKLITSPILFEDAEYLVFDLEYDIFPRRVKLYFKSGKLYEVYIYRSDY